MKNLITVSIILLVILTGCTSSETSKENLTADESSEKLVYLQEINSALEKSNEFETIEVQGVYTLNGYTQMSTRLFSRNPNMYYLYPTNKEDVPSGAYYENIYIEDENVIGSIRDASFNGGKEGELAFIETEIDTIFIEGEFTSNIFDMGLTQSIDFIKSIEKEDNVYTLIASDAYFENVRENTIENIKEQGKELPEEMQGIVSQNIAYIESQESPKLTVIINIEDEKAIKIEQISSMMASQFAENYTVTQEKFLTESNTKMLVIRFNDEEIRNEILKVYDMYK